MCTPSIPGAVAQPSYWKVGAAGMTQDEIDALPTYTGGYDADAEADGTTQAGMNALQSLRDAAIEKWKLENPERYQEGLRKQRIAAGLESEPAPPARQAGKSPRKGAGGGGGGGSGSGPSSAGTLLTPGATDGVNPGDLDLSKNTLLGL